MRRRPAVLSVLACAGALAGAGGTGCSAVSDACGPDTCDTCCTADGVCVAEISHGSCGTRGEACRDCGDLACLDGVCSASPIPAGPIELEAHRAALASVLRWPGHALRAPGDRGTSPST